MKQKHYLCHQTNRSTFAPNLLFSHCSLILATAISFANSAFAQSVALEEITVTAQKRAESAQDVGIAITAFSGEQMEQLGVSNSVDIAKFTPGVSLSGSFAGQQQQFSIRGVTQNDFNDHVESPNAIYIDEAYVAMQQGQIFATFDMERVEVLKGPQGTLFGRNATGGLVHFVTKKPTQEFEGYVDATVGSYNQQRFEGALSGPISEAVSYRLSGLWTEHEGYLENQFDEGITYTPENLTPPLSNGEPALAGAGDDLGGDETWALRGQLQFDIDDTQSLLVSGFYTESTQSIGPYQSAPVIAELDDQGRILNTYRVANDEVREAFNTNTGAAVDGAFDGDFDGLRPVPGGDWYGYRDPDGNGLDRTSSDFAFDDANTYETGGATLNYGVDFDSFTFTSVSDYKYHEKSTFLDLEAGPQSQFTWSGVADIDSFTQELRINGETDTTRWVTGFYYLNIDALSITGLSALDTGTVLPDFGFVDFDEPRISDLQTESYSVFGQMEFDLTPELTLVTGLRITRESKDYAFDVRFSGSILGAGLGNENPFGWDAAALNAPSSRATGEFTDSTSENLTTGKIQLDWHLQENILLYAGFNRGVKAGSFNSSGAALPDDQIPYDKEILHAYEVGIKSDLFDGLARLNAAVYYYDYQDYQASRWDGLGNVITNNDAEIKGVDVEFIASPTNGLDLMLSAGYVDAQVNDLDLIGDGSILVDVRPTFSPETTLSGLVRYAFYDVFQGSLSFQLSASYQSSIYSNLSNFDSTEFDDWTVVDVRTRWQSNDSQWAVDVFVNNAFDETYNVIGFDLAMVCGCNEEAQGKPRWMGASLNYQF